jgi:hypothetical protein
MLELVEYEPVVQPDPLWSAYQANGDREAFATDYTAFFRGFSEQALFAPLDRPDVDRERIAGTFYDRLRSAIAASPERVATQWRVSLLHARRL